MVMSDKHYNDNPIYDTDERLSQELGSSIGYIFEKNEGRLRKLKDVRTLLNYYKNTRECNQQVQEQGILSFIINKITEELLKHLEPYYTGTIVENIGIQTRIKGREGTVELNSKIDLKTTLNPYVEFIAEINGRNAYSIKFTFQIKTNGHLRKLTFSKNSEKGKSIHIEKVGIEIELFLVQIKFSNLLTSSSDISFDKMMKLGNKSFDIQNISLYPKDAVPNE